MGIGASSTLHNSFSRLKRSSRKIHPEPPSRRNGGPVFGISLSELRESVQMVCGIPWVLRDMVDILEKHGLQEEALFRVCGSVQKTAKLKAHCDRGKPVNASGDVQNVASLLKMFLRELPQAVIPDPQCVEISRRFREFTDELTLNHMLREQLTSLPEDNYYILSYVCHFLLKVASYSQINHMSVENLATIFGPCLFRVPFGPSMQEEQTLCNAVVSYILKNQSLLMSRVLDSPSPPPVLTALSHPEDMEVIAEPPDPEGHADTEANGDVFGRDSPHSDRVKLSLPEDDKIPQTSDEEKSFQKKLSNCQHPEAFPATETGQEDPPTALDCPEANCTPSAPETGLDCEGPEGTAPEAGQLLLHIANGNASPLYSLRCPNLCQSLRDHENTPSPPCTQPFIKAKPVTRTQPPDSRAIAMFAKHVQALKEKIRWFEEQFEQERNCKQSLKDKMVNTAVFQLMNALAKTRLKIRDLRLRESEGRRRPEAADEPADMCSNSAALQGAPEHIQKPTLQDTVELLLKRLREKRQALGLPDDIKGMTQEQLAREKIMLQECLLYFEGLHGRPENKQERTAVKPLYDRYRAVKQLLRAASTLTTIAEEENSDDDSTQRGPLPSSREIHLQVPGNSPSKRSEGSNGTFVSPTDQTKTLRQPAISMSNLHEVSRNMSEGNVTHTREKQHITRWQKVCAAAAPQRVPGGEEETAENTESLRGATTSRRAGPYRRTTAFHRQRRTRNINISKGRSDYWRFC